MPAYVKDYFGSFVEVEVIDLDRDMVTVKAKCGKPFVIDPRKADDTCDYAFDLYWTDTTTVHRSKVVVTPEVDRIECNHSALRFEQDRIVCILCGKEFSQDEEVFDGGE